MTISLRKFLASRSNVSRSFSESVANYCFDEFVHIVQSRLEDPDSNFISEHAYYGIYNAADFVVDLLKDSGRICTELLATELVSNQCHSNYSNLINLLDSIVSSDLESIDVFDYEDLRDRLIEKICTHVYEYDRDDSKDLEVIANYSAPFRSFSSLSLDELDMLSVILLDLLDCD